MHEQTNSEMGSPARVETALALHTRRRGFLARALGLAGLAGVAGRATPALAQATSTVNDGSILNFALNFEYLGAEFYTYGLTGKDITTLGIPVAGVGTLGPVTVKPNPVVPGLSAMQLSFFNELAMDERAHVLFVRQSLTTFGVAPIARPAIDLLNSFNLASMMAGLGPFDVYASPTNFLLGAYTLEDVCVTALHGAAPLLKNKNIIAGASGLLGVESYQAGSIRAQLYELGQGTATQAISALRASASGVGDYGAAQGPLDLGPAGTTSIVLADANALAFARTFRQILNIAYLAPGATAGGFFPKGVNGAIQG